ncbi:hypothetical protein PHLCEN_2v8531 [Hermanssonia centrifuga]|uniref:Uncharacterized protein n=1 Tax=Hermanssonia centrifuga TaxID=98765 RepID=A0A2R6NTC0_9APHY|nr:hypothetical protein PHLCEN_2v8531 [Hermanssonia centrifuga]
MRIIEALLSLKDVHLSHILWERQPIHPPTVIRASRQLASLHVEECQEQWIAVWMLVQFRMHPSYSKD